MTDQTECRPGTIATIGLPADMAVVSAIVAGVVRTRPGVCAVQHQDHLDVCAPATEVQDPQNTLCVPAGQPVSVSEDSGTCGGSCGAARALRRDVRELTTALGESNDARVRMLAKWICDQIEPETVTTAAEVEALPVGSVCVDPYDERGDAPVVICKNAAGRWQAMGDRTAGPVFTSTDVAAVTHGRLLCVYRPGGNR